ncbi:MAG: hypothetical protein K6D59_08870 [Bacteroidales bacterium]|nr:hypothetical protein [Bacteroidales bacterium]
MLLAACRDKIELLTLTLVESETFEETPVVACSGMVSNDGGATTLYLNEASAICSAMELQPSATSSQNNRSCDKHTNTMIPHAR